MERLGLGPDELRSRNPKPIYARLSAYGGNGPHGDRPGIYLMIQAEAGMTSGMRTPDGKPQLIPLQLVDNASGHVLAQAVLAALLNRERHGVADIVSVAMYDVAVGLQANQLTAHLHPRSVGPPVSKPNTKGRKTVGFAAQPSDAFRTADGYIVISAYVPKHWELLCQRIDRPDLLHDKRFTDQRSRSINYAELTGLVHTWKQAVDTPLFAENKLALDVGSGEDALTLIRTPARYSTFTAAVTDPPPAAGEHNEELLTAPPPYRHRGPRYPLSNRASRPRGSKV